MSLQIFKRPAFKRPAYAAVMAASLLALGACSSTGSTNDAKGTAPASAGTTAGADSGKPIEAIARLQPTQGSSVNGIVRFTPQADGSVRVHGRVEGLSANSEHGFHVHEKGDCSSGDGLSAGGHFNPGSHAHGKFDGTAHHAGDLPSLKSDGAGVAGVDFVSRSIALDRSANSVQNRGLIVHKDPDDYTTQPTGNSGARLACAVIERGA